MSRRLQEIQDQITSYVERDCESQRHVHLRGNRRVILAQLEEAVRSRDGAALQLAVARLSRLGVKREEIEGFVRKPLSNG